MFKKYTNMEGTCPYYFVSFSCLQTVSLFFGLQCVVKNKCQLSFLGFGAPSVRKRDSDGEKIYQPGSGYWRTK